MMSPLRLKFYDGSVLKPQGKRRIDVKVTDLAKPRTLEFVMLEDPAQRTPLLSADTCESMGLAKMSVPLNYMGNGSTRSTLTKDCILEEYKDVFQGLGRLPGEYHMELDPSVLPVQHAPRKVPIHLKPQVEERIRQMEDMGVIARVTEPTRWISSMVVVQQPNKLRICLDPKDLNQALLRARYPMPTLEDILPCLSKARVFSKLDAKDGFWQVVLDQESSYLTTFWTPSGRYRWLRMPFGINTASEEFQRRLQDFMEGLLGVKGIADDTLVFGCGDDDEEAKKDHDKNIIGALQRAREVGLRLKCIKVPVPDNKRVILRTHIRSCRTATRSEEDQCSTGNAGSQGRKSSADLSRIGQLYGSIHYELSRHCGSFAATNS